MPADPALQRPRHRPGRGQTARRAVAALLVLVLALPAPLVTAQVRLPALGDGLPDELSVGSERRYGDQVMREIRRDPAYLDDPVLLAYVQSIWQPLVDAARKRGDISPDADALLAWEAFLVQDRSVNAFALPGGFVGIHLGMIAVTDSRDELASVLAHELSHVTQRHIARSVAAASQQSALGIAAMILGMIAASRSGNADMAQAALAGGQAVMLQGQLNFSRDMEREADRIGYGVFSDAGHAPSGMATMFEKLDHASRLNDSGGFPYLRSHPLTVDRLAEARSRVGLAGRAANPAAAASNAAPAGSPTDSTPNPAAAQGSHELMRARAMVLMEPTVIAWRRHVDQASAPLAAAGRAGRLYAGVLASSLLREHAVSETLWTALSAATAAAAGTGSAGAGATELRWLRAETLLARGDADAAARALDSPLPAAADTAGSVRPELLLRAQTALRRFETGSGPRAEMRAVTEQLQSWVAVQKLDAAAWALLGQCHAASGARLRSLRAQAEARVSLGDIPSAIDRLRAAQSEGRRGENIDFVEASVIDARLRDLEGQRRRLAAEMRERGGSRGSGEPEPR